MFFSKYSVSSYNVTAITVDQDVNSKTVIITRHLSETIAMPKTATRGRGFVLKRPSRVWTRVCVTALTIGKHMGLPVFQNFVQFFPKVLVTRVTEQIIFSAFGVEMLQPTQSKSARLNFWLRSIKNSYTKLFTVSSYRVDHHFFRMWTAKSSNHRTQKAAQKPREAEAVTCSYGNTRNLKHWGCVF